MERKGVPGIFLTLLFIVNVLTLALNIQPAKASGTIFIRAEGSIDPSDAPVSSLDNVTYTFTNNTYDEVVIERSNIIIDGNGHVLQGSGSSNGFSLSCIKNVTVKNTNINGFYIGIYLNSTWHNVISQNNITNNRHSGIRLHFSSNNAISRNNLSHNFYAFSFCSSSQNNVSVNRITNNKDGIFLDSSSGNIISENNVLDNQRRGVALILCGSNTISGNRIINNTNFGVRLYQSSNNTVLGNNLTDNIYGAWLFLSYNNKFHYNNFIANSQHVYIQPSGSTNFWDNDIEGNYWSNYTGADSDDDGIGDTEHVIDENNQDNFPLMGMFYDFEVTVEHDEVHHVHVISNSTVQNLEVLWWLSSPNEYLQPGQKFIHFFVAGKENATGFCRATIPRTMLNGTYTVLVDWEEVTANELATSNTTHAYLYFTHKDSEHEVIIIPEFPSFLILLSFMMITLLAAIIYRGKRNA